MEKATLKTSNTYEECVDTKIDLVNALATYAVKTLDVKLGNLISKYDVANAIEAARLANEIIGQLMELEE